MSYFGSFGQSKSEALGTLEPVLGAAPEAHQTGSYSTYLPLMTDQLAEKNHRAGF